MDRQGPQQPAKVAVMVVGDTPLTVEPSGNYRQGKGSEESFLSHILVSTSSFVADDEVLTKSSSADTDVVTLYTGGL